MYTYEYVKNETGRVVDILVDGNSVKRSYMRGFRKAQDKGYFHLHDTDCLATNPISGVTVCLNGLEATIYSFCYKWYMRYDMGREDNRQLYDDMKMFLLSINSNAYYDLID